MSGGRIVKPKTPLAILLRRRLLRELEKKESEARLVDDEARAAKVIAAEQVATRRRFPGSIVVPLEQRPTPEPKPEPQRISRKARRSKGNLTQLSNPLVRSRILRGLDKEKDTLVAPPLLEVLEVATLLDQEMARELTSALAGGDDGAQKDAAPSVEALGRREGRMERPSDEKIPREEPSVKSKRRVGKNLPTWDGVVKTRIPGADEFSDVNFADRLANEYAEDLRYCQQWQKWLIWDGTKWVPELSRSGATRAAIALSCESLEVARSYALPPEGNKNYELEKARKAKLIESAVRYQSNQKIQSIITLASCSTKIAVSSDDLDSDAWLLNVQNGTVRLRSGMLVEHYRDSLITKITGTNFDATAECPMWLDFLNQVTVGRSDLASYLQRVVGYSLTGDVSEHKLFFCFGLGSNGKGTFLKVLQTVLGDYAQPAPRGMLEETHSNDHPANIANLHRARFVVCPEVERDRKFAEGLVKSLTSEDPLSARRMREDFWKFMPTHKLILQGNYKMVIVGNDDGIWRRVHCIPWDAKFDESKGEAIKGLADALLTAEAPGILAWAVRGCLAWQEQGLAPPESVTAATSRYKAEMNNIRQYAIERIRSSYGSVVTRMEVRQDYEDWANENGYYAMEPREFTGQLRSILKEEHGAEEGTGRVDGFKSPVRIWKNVKITDDTMAS